MTFERQNAELIDRLADEAEEAQREFDNTPRWRLIRRWKLSAKWMSLVSAIQDSEQVEARRRLGIGPGQ